MVERQRESPRRSYRPTAPRSAWHLRRCALLRRSRGRRRERRASDAVPKAVSHPGSPAASSRSADHVASPSFPGEAGGGDEGETDGFVGGVSGVTGGLGGGAGARIV